MSLKKYLPDFDQMVRWAVIFIVYTIVDSYLGITAKVMNFVSGIAGGQS